MEDLIQRPAAEVEDPKVSLLHLGFEKTRKSTYLCSLPNPYFVHPDPNDGAIEAYGHPRFPWNTDDPAGSYRMFRDNLLPMIYNRELPFDSICIDSAAFLHDAMCAAIQTPLDSKGQPNKFAYWDQVKTEAIDTYTKLVSTTKPFPGDPTRHRYNIGVACHLTEITNDSGGVIGFAPALTGSFKQIIGRLFKTVLYCVTEIQVTPREGQAALREEVAYCTTTPPNAYVKCGDSMGIEGGRWNRLPTRVSGMYPALAEAWGFPNQAPQETPK
jgi:hypothetical protein